MRKKLHRVLLTATACLVISNSAYAAKVVIDPGHGGSDPGAIGVNGLQEKQVNLDISKLLESELKDRGYEVTMTRTNDVYLSLKQRVEFTNRQNADLFVSVHANSNPSSKISGTQVLYYDDNYPQASYPASPEMRKLTAQSKKLAQLVLDSALKETQMANKGLVPSAVYVVRMGTIPSILVETAFLSNQQDADKLTDPSFKSQMATGIADGIQRFLPLTFHDIGGHWAADAILTMYENGYVSGVSEHAFAPNRAVTRAEYIAMLDRLFHFSQMESVHNTEPSEALPDAVETEQPMNESENSAAAEVNEPARQFNASFSDLNESHWAYYTMQKAADLGIVSGFPDGTVRPDQTISRAEAAALFQRIWNQQAEASSNFRYSDVNDYSWYADAVYNLRAAAILMGKTDTEFAPLDKMTRAEVTVMLYRSLNHISH